MTLAHMEMTPALTVVAFLFATFALFGVLRYARAAHARRVDELEAATALLREHFESAQRLIRDPAPSADLKRFVRLFSVSVGRRDVARNVAASVVREIRPIPSPNSARMMRTIQAELGRLTRHRPDLVDDMAVLVNAGFVSMMLRWPETEAAALKVMAAPPASRDETAIIRERSERVIAASASAFPQELCPAAA